MTSIDDQSNLIKSFVKAMVECGGRSVYGDGDEKVKCVFEFDFGFSFIFFTFGECFEKNSQRKVLDLLVSLFVCESEMIEYQPKPFSSDGSSGSSGSDGSGSVSRVDLVFNDVVYRCSGPMFTNECSL